jgi:hypothetical protein
MLACNRQREERRMVERMLLNGEGYMIMIGINLSPFTHITIIPLLL